jgi:hypothetical protein
VSNESELDVAPSKSCRSQVRFTESEYRRIVRDQLETGKSVPWLLKTAYFKKGISAPTLDAETRKSALRELAYIGNNLNQLARMAHVRGFDTVKGEVLDLLQAIRMLKAFLGCNYGDR